MKIPTYIKQKWVDKDGYPTDEMHNFMDLLVGQMQGALSNEGFAIPNVAATTVADLSKSGDGTLVYATNPSNPANDKLQVKVNGTFKTIQTV
jgi:hypothetical protein